MRTTYDWIIVLLLKVQIHINSSINFCKAEALRGIGSDYKKQHKAKTTRQEIQQAMESKELMFDSFCVEVI